VQLEQDVAVEVGEDGVEVDVDLAHPPEWRLGYRGVRADLRAHRGIGDRRGVVGHLDLLAQRPGVVEHLGHQAGPGLLVDELVHDREPGEGVLAVEDAGLVDLV
jgi:hypothetical protein